jgi:hypothetical protein
LKHRWNVLLWAGFAIVVLSFISYVKLFYIFPITRDVPRVNYLLFLAGGALLAWGLKRAYGEPERYRGKISGPILSALSLLIAGLFAFGVLYLSKQLPASTGAARVGQAAPMFTLTDVQGKQTSLADLIKGNRGVLLIFYRGYW